MKEIKNLSIEELLNKINGVQTKKSIIKILGVSEKRAIYLISRLRKKGYVKTTQEKDNTRVYNISKKNEISGKSYYDIINKHAPLGINPLKDYKIHSRTPSLEETLIYALKTKDIRTIIASLALYKKIKNWNLLYILAKKENLQYQISALYEVARTIFKTRKMSKRFKNISLPDKNQKFQYIIPNLRSNDFQNIEKKWHVYIPLNISDLEEYYDNNTRTRKTF